MLSEVEDVSYLLLIVQSMSVRAGFVGQDDQRNDNRPSSSEDDHAHLQEMWVPTAGGCETDAAADD